MFTRNGSCNMFTCNPDKDGVEDEESCFGGFGDHRVRHEKVHLFIFFQVILVIEIPSSPLLRWHCILLNRVWISNIVEKKYIFGASFPFEILFGQIKMKEAAMWRKYIDSQIIPTPANWSIGHHRKESHHRHREFYYSLTEVVQKGGSVLRWAVDQGGVCFFHLNLKWSRY